MELGELTESVTDRQTDRQTDTHTQVNLHMDRQLPIFTIYGTVIPNLENYNGEIWRDRPDLWLPRLRQMS